MKMFKMSLVLLMVALLCFHSGLCGNGQMQQQMQIKIPPGQLKQQQHWPPGHNKGNEVPGQGYRRCGHFKCLTEGGVVCDRGNNKCPCPPGSVGDGRIQCAKPDQSCLCTIHGDPHIVNFRGQDFTLPLPCNHVIADLKTPPTKKIPDGCRLFISGRAWYPSNGPQNSDVSFENYIEISVQTSKCEFTTRISKAGFTKTDLKSKVSGESGESAQEGSKTGSEKSSSEGGKSSEASSSKEGKSSGGSSSMSEKSSEENKNRVRGRRDTRHDDIDIDVQTDVDEAGFHRVIIADCDVRIKYRSHDGSFSLETPVRSAEKKGLCGPCDSRWNQTSSGVHSSRKQVLQLLLTSLQTTSPIDDTNANIYPSCTTLTQTIEDCPVMKKVPAVNFCGEMLTNQHVKSCLSKKLGKEHVQDTFAKCYQGVCTRSMSCASLKDLFKGCGTSAHLDQYLSDGKICKP